MTFLVEAHSPWLLSAEGTLPHLPGQNLPTESVQTPQVPLFLSLESSRTLCLLPHLKGGLEGQGFSGLVKM